MRRACGRRRTLPAAVVASLAAAAACAARGPAEPLFVPMPAPAAAEERLSRGGIRDYPSALAAIVAVFEKELGLPRVEATLVLFPSRRSFENGLLQIGYPPRLARSASAFNAIGGATAVLVNGGTVGGFDWERRVRLLAHELVHTLQYRLAGGTRGASEQWLREGAAEWIACRVTSELGYAPFAAQAEALLAPLAGLRIGAAPAPLGELSTFPQWVEAQRRYDVPLYAQAFVAAELLIDTHGLPAVVAYFSRFATTSDRRSAFADTFRVDLERFERQFQVRWHSVVSQRSLRAGD